MPIVLITGVSRGLGISAMESALNLGCSVVGIARSKPDERLSTLLKNHQATATFLQGDVCDLALQESAVKTAIEKFGGLDCVLHNAAVLEPLSPTDSASDAEWKRAFDINFHSAVSLTRVALPHLRESAKKHGVPSKLIFVSSGASEHAYYSWGAYCTSKAALHMFAKVLAKEEPGIISASVKPGVCDTAMQGVIRETGAGAMRPEDHASFIGRHERGELNDPNVVGHVLARLAMECPSEFSGEIFNWNDPKLTGLQPAPLSSKNIN
ncbi:NAD(P)-binding protein [Gonapodya prolifera JEL478]|uniref:NAD(P)-binding protein n=1 Tax=Gonapodya prolifera (strain JEL478) TaxID=1344416 RepID=A0A139A5W2_GONPJ|nr:NAD(P)-binding protein [Gonapodya prolifera JEL478]|eukprot:KXS11875.1 NAD(P)-binding protein [Gonapodya prolifera JEL478]